MAVLAQPRTLTVVAQHHMRKTDYADPVDWSCWARADGTLWSPCNQPAVFDVGLCERHYVELIGTPNGAKLRPGRPRQPKRVR